MADRSGHLTRELRKLLQRPDESSDADLLARFVADRDADAFAVLVQRHGPMVLAVGRRVTGHRQDAEDTFQATFLVLARRARVVRPAAQLANWLHGVAYRTALEARRAAAVRRAKEQKAAEMRDVSTITEAHPPDLREVLDRELAQLPEPYRLAIVLCDLEGLSRRDAAERLQWSERTLAGRLARGRKMLARRLSPYGLSVPAVGLAGVPAALAESTVRLGILATTAGVAGAASTSVLTLTEGAMKGFLVTKLKALAATLVIGCAVLATAVGAWQANATGASEGRQKAGRDADKERIGELERERDQLKKEVAELKARLEQVQAAQKAAMNEAKRAQLDLMLQTYQQAIEQAQQGPTEGYRILLRPDPVPRDNPVNPVLGNNGKPAGTVNPMSPVTDANTGMAKTNHAAKSEDVATTKSDVRVYAVEGLAATEKEAEALIRVIQKTVEPKTWQMVGGEGVIEYLASRKVLVVRHTQAAHEKVAELLKLLLKSEAPAKPSK